MVNDSIEIEGGIPVPPPNARTSGGKRQFPLDQLEVGQSFLVPLDDGESLMRLRNRLSASIVYATQTLHRKFTTRRRYQERDGESGVRVWRIE